MGLLFFKKRPRDLCDSWPRAAVCEEHRGLGMSPRRRWSEKRGSAGKGRCERQQLEQDTDVAGAK